jgi:hypothetical protein
MGLFLKQQSSIAVYCLLTKESKLFFSLYIYINIEMAAFTVYTAPFQTENGSRGDFS